MEFFRKLPNIDFMKRRRAAVVFSGTLILISLVSLAVQGLEFGIDFTGGTVVELRFPGNVDAAAVEAKLKASGFGKATVQHIGSAREVLVRVAPEADVKGRDTGMRIVEAIGAQAGKRPEVLRTDRVGPQVSGELAADGALAMLIVFAAILVYVSLRYEWRLALGSVIALVHDSLITVGFFSVFRWQFDLSVLAAVLTVIGYSLNDTIVIYDRLRENFRRIRRSDPITIANASLNQTLSRTIMTSFLTLLAVLAMLFLGGPSLFGLSAALVVGIVIGTYSSIYIASAAALALGLSSADLIRERPQEANARP